MGAGIAQVMAHKGGYNVTLADVSDKALQTGNSIISKSLTRIFKKSMADKGADEQAAAVKDIVGKIAFSKDAAQAVSQADLVVEAIIENVGIKQELFSFLDGKAPKDCIFATNTSSLSVTDVASTVSAERKKIFGGESPARLHGRTGADTGVLRGAGGSSCGECRARTATGRITAASTLLRCAADCCLSIPLTEERNLLAEHSR